MAQRRPPTTDYLLALNQRAESLLAGIALEKQARLTLTDVLLQSGPPGDGDDAHNTADELRTG